MCKFNTGYHDISVIEQNLWACTLKLGGLALRTGAQTMLYFSLVCYLSISYVPWVWAVTQKLFEMLFAMLEYMIAINLSRGK